MTLVEGKDPPRGHPWHPDSPSGAKNYLLPDEVLQHRALAGALAAHHCDLRQVQVRILPDGCKRVLHPVHQRDQILHSPVPHPACGSVLLRTNDKVEVESTLTLTQCLDLQLGYSCYVMWCDADSSSAAFLLPPQSARRRGLRFIASQGCQIRSIISQSSPSKPIKCSAAQLIQDFFLKPMPILIFDV